MEVVVVVMVVVAVDLIEKVAGLEVRFRVLSGEMELGLMGMVEMGFLRDDEAVCLVVLMAAAAG